jgi:hypothetical protein
MNILERYKDSNAYEQVCERSYRAHNPISHSRGKRGIAGSLAFQSFSDAELRVLNTEGMVVLETTLATDVPNRNHTVYSRESLESATRGMSHGNIYFDEAAFIDSSVLTTTNINTGSVVSSEPISFEMIEGAEPVGRDTLRRRGLGIPFDPALVNATVSPGHSTIPATHYNRIEVTLATGEVMILNNVSVREL